jgi:hypothetical protein
MEDRRKLIDSIKSFEKQTELVPTNDDDAPKMKVSRYDDRENTSE